MAKAFLPIIQDFLKALATDKTCLVVGLLLNWQNLSPKTVQRIKNYAILILIECKEEKSWKTNR
ncbi:MAG: hypothetical protein K6E22_12635 [Treponema sp.]|nr:hypothetical protein [Treponema sp.]